MSANEQINLFSEISAEQCVTINGGTPVNFDLSTYAFDIGAGATFNGGLTTNVINIAFKAALYTPTQSAGGSGSSSGSGSTGPVQISYSGGPFPVKGN